METIKIMIKNNRNDGDDTMCYKQELQNINEEKLRRKFAEENVPLIIQRYFINIESRAARINYWVVIKDLLLWLMKKNIIRKNSLSEITADDFYNIESEDITEYLEQKEKTGMSPTTLNTRKNMFRSFWNYLKRSNKCPVNHNIIESVSYRGISSNNNLTKKLPSDEQIDAMEKKICKKADDFLRIRNFAILRLLCGSGLRVSELVGLELSDLFLNEEIPYVRIIGKGKYREVEARDVLLTSKAKNSLESWLNERSKVHDIENVQAVFITKKKKRMTEGEVQKMFVSMSDNEITPHMIRHYYATVFSRVCGIAFVQQNLGHTTMNTTINNYANGSYGARELLNDM